MKIDGNIHCLFEQSGTFKNQFKKLNYQAFDYDIQNNFNQTDFVIDLFKQIENAYNNKKSIFDTFNKNDLIIAFFPCIYFTGYINPLYYTLENMNYKCLSNKQKFKAILNRNNKRNKFYILIYKMTAICILRNLRLIIQNPFSKDHYLYNNFLKNPDIIDTNRRRRGDYFVKPTGYWFFNCQPTHGLTLQEPKQYKQVRNCKQGKQPGICSEQRSMISLDYARNFICDFIIGKQQYINKQINLF